MQSLIHRIKYEMVVRSRAPHLRCLIPSMVVRSRAPHLRCLIPSMVVRSRAPHLWCLIPSMVVRSRAPHLLQLECEKSLFCKGDFFRMQSLLGGVTKMWEQSPVSTVSNPLKFPQTARPKHQRGTATGFLRLPRYLRLSSWHLRHYRDKRPPRERQVLSCGAAQPAWWSVQP